MGAHADPLDEPIFVRADKTVTYGELMQVMEVIASVGYKHISLVKEIEDRPQQAVRHPSFAQTTNAASCANAIRSRIEQYWIPPIGAQSGENTISVEPMFPTRPRYCIGVRMMSSCTRAGLAAACTLAMSRSGSKKAMMSAMVPCPRVNCTSGSVASRSIAWRALAWRFLGSHYQIFSNRNVGAKLGSIVTRATGSTGRGSSQLIR